MLAAAALDLISPDEFSEINKLRKIRNEFAHSKVASFNDEKIAKLCSSLKFAPKEPTHSMPGRSQFTMSAVAVCASLVNRPVETVREQRSPRDWADVEVRIE